MSTQPPKTGYSGYARTEGLDEPDIQSRRDLARLVEPLRYCEVGAELAAVVRSMTDFTSDPGSAYADIREPTLEQDDHADSAAVTITLREGPPAKLTLARAESRDADELADEPPKTGYDPRSSQWEPGVHAHQSIEDMARIRDDIEHNPQGAVLGNVIVCLHDLIVDKPVGEQRRQLRDVRDVRTGPGYATCLLAYHDCPPSRLSLTFRANRHDEGA